MSSQRHSSNDYTPEQIQEAAEWFLIVHDAQDVPSELVQEWTHWLNASEGNRGAYERVEEAYHMAMPNLFAPLMPQERAADAHIRREAEHEYDGNISVAEWLDKGTQACASKSAGAVRAALPRSLIVSFWEGATRWAGTLRSGRISAWARPFNAAVALALMITVLWLAGDTRGPMVLPAVAAIETRTGEHKELVLADGSRVTLGARSNLSIEFDGSLRIVRLDRGEAYFSVIKDSQRPFVVSAPGGTITAVGTAFNVRATRDRLTIAVTEGSVRVERKVDSTAAAAESAWTSPELRLSSGQLVSFTSMTASGALPLPMPSATQVDVNDAVRWRAGWLVYRNEPLSYVIADIARYTDLQLDLSESAPADLRFSGAVFKDDVQEWLAALPRIFPLTIRADGRHMIIDARSDAAASADAAAEH